MKKLKLSYGKPHLIVENDRIKSLASSGFQKKGKKAKAPATVEQAPQTQSPWSANIGCGNAALLRQAGVQLLFSQNFGELQHRQQHVLSFLLCAAILLMHFYLIFP